MRSIIANPSGAPRLLRRATRWSVAAVAAVALVGQLAGVPLITPAWAQTEEPVEPTDCVQACLEGSEVVCTILGECTSSCGLQCAPCRQCIAMFYGRCVSTCVRQFGPQ
jgi:hypothetical protein